MSRKSRKTTRTLASSARPANLSDRSGKSYRWCRAEEEGLVDAIKASKPLGAFDPGGERLEDFGDPDAFGGDLSSRVAALSRRQRFGTRGCLHRLGRGVQGVNPVKLQDRSIHCRQHTSVSAT
jgi:hypothetical protein